MSVVQKVSVIMIQNIIILSQILSQVAPLPTTFENSGKLTNINTSSRAYFASIFQRGEKLAEFLSIFDNCLVQLITHKDIRIRSKSKSISNLNSDYAQSEEVEAFAHFFSQFQYHHELKNGNGIDRNSNPPPIFTPLVIETKYDEHDELARRFRPQHTTVNNTLVVFEKLEEKYFIYQNSRFSSCYSRLYLSEYTDALNLDHSKSQRENPEGIITNANTTPGTVIDFGGGFDNGLSFGPTFNGSTTENETITVFSTEEPELETTTEKPEESELEKLETNLQRIPRETLFMRENPDFILIFTRGFSKTKETIPDFTRASVTSIFIAILLPQLNSNSNGSANSLTFPSTSLEIRMLCLFCDPNEPSEASSSPVINHYLADLKIDIGIDFHLGLDLINSGDESWKFHSISIALPPSHLLSSRSDLLHLFIKLHGNLQQSYVESRPSTRTNCSPYVVGLQTTPNHCSNFFMQQYYNYTSRMSEKPKPKPKPKPTPTPKPVERENLDSNSTSNSTSTSTVTLNDISSIFGEAWLLKRPRKIGSIRTNFYYDPNQIRNVHTKICGYELFSWMPTAEQFIPYTFVTVLDVQTLNVAALWKTLDGPTWISCALSSLAMIICLYFVLPVGVDIGAENGGNKKERGNFGNKMPRKIMANGRELYKNKESINDNFNDSSWTWSIGLVLSFLLEKSILPMRNSLPLLNFKSILILILWAHMTMIIANSYKGVLFSYLSFISIPKTPQNIHEIFNSRLFLTTTAAFTYGRGSGGSHSLIHSNFQELIDEMTKAEKEHEGHDHSHGHQNGRENDTDWKSFLEKFKYRLTFLNCSMCELVFSQMQQGQNFQLYDGWRGSSDEILGFGPGAGETHLNNETSSGAGTETETFERKHRIPRDHIYLSSSGDASLYSLLKNSVKRSSAHSHNNFIIVQGPPVNLFLQRVPVFVRRNFLAPFITNILFKIVEAGFFNLWMEYEEANVKLSQAHKLINYVDKMKGMNNSQIEEYKENLNKPPTPNKNSNSSSNPNSTNAAQKDRKVRSKLNILGLIFDSYSRSGASPKTGSGGKEVPFSFQIFQILLIVFFVGLLVSGLVMIGELFSSGGASEKSGDENTYFYWRESKERSKWAELKLYLQRRQVYPNSSPSLGQNYVKVLPILYNSDLEVKNRNWNEPTDFKKRVYRFCAQWTSRSVGVVCPLYVYRK